MYILKESIRYNNIDYLKGQIAGFSDEDIKEIGKYVEKIKGEQIEVQNSKIIPDKEVKNTKKNIKK